MNNHSQKIQISQRLTRLFSLRQSLQAISQQATKLALLSTLLTGMAVSHAQTPYSQTPQGQQFIASMAGQYGYSQAQLTELFSHVYRDDKILEKISRPKEKTTPWFKYQRIFLDDNRINNGLAFYQQNEAVLNKAYETYGVSPFIITAIIGVETRYGKVMGKDKVLTALATIGFDYPKRADFFMSELQAFLQMAAQEKFNPMSPKGSYAGAMGMAQFMPSSFLKYAVDYDGDGKRDLWSNPHDAIFSVANYLKGHGWERDGEICSEAKPNDAYNGTVSHYPFTTLGELRKQGISAVKDGAFTDDTWAGYLELDGEDGYLPFITYDNFAVITTYNTSPMYAMAVKNLAERIEEQWVMRGHQ